MGKRNNPLAASPTPAQPPRPVFHLPPAPVMSATCSTPCRRRGHGRPWSPPLPHLLPPPLDPTTPTPRTPPPPPPPRQAPPRLGAVSPPWPRAPLEPSPPSPAPSRHGPDKSNPAHPLDTPAPPLPSSSSPLPWGKVPLSRRRPPLRPGVANGLHR